MERERSNQASKSETAGVPIAGQPAVMYGYLVACSNAHYRGTSTICETHVHVLATAIEISYAMLSIGGVPTNPYMAGGRGQGPKGGGSGAQCNMQG